MRGARIRGEQLLALALAVIFTLLLVRLAFAVLDGLAMLKELQ